MSMSNGLGGSYFSQQPPQRVSPLTFASSIPMSIGGARARAPYASGGGGLYNAVTAAAVSAALWPSLFAVHSLHPC